MRACDFAQRVAVVAAVAAEGIEPADEDELVRQPGRGDEFSERLHERVRVLVKVDRGEKEHVGLAQAVALEPRALRRVERPLVPAARIHAVMDDARLFPHIHLRADLVEAHLRIHDHAGRALQRRDREPAPVERPQQPDAQAAPQMLRGVHREDEPRAARDPHRRDAAAAAGEKDINRVPAQQPRDEDLLAQDASQPVLIARARPDELHIWRSRLEQVPVRRADEDEILIPRIARGEPGDRLLEKIERPGGLLRIFGKCGEGDAQGGMGGTRRKNDSSLSCNRPVRESPT